MNPILAGNTLSNSSLFDTIKSDLTLDQQPSTTDQDSLLKACRVATYCLATEICINALLKYYFPARPTTKQFDCVPSWFRVVIVAPIWEEVVFTYAPSLLMGNYAQIIAPVIFGALHLSTQWNDRNFEIKVFTATALMNFIHQRVARRDPGSELPVVIMSHMLQNLIMFQLVSLRG